MKYLLRMFDLYRLLNNLLGRVQIRVEMTKEQYLEAKASKLGENDDFLMNPTVEIRIKPLLERTKGIGMPMDSVLALTAHIMSIPPEDRYDAVVLMKHPKNPELEFYLEPWTLNKFLVQAKPLCVSYSLWRAMRDMKAAMQEESAKAEGTEEATADIKPLVH